MTLFLLSIHGNGEQGTRLYLLKALINLLLTGLCVRSCYVVECSLLNAAEERTRCGSSLLLAENQSVHSRLAHGSEQSGAHSPLI